MTSNPSPDLLYQTIQDPDPFLSLDATVLLRKDWERRYEWVLNGH